MPYAVRLLARQWLGLIIVAGLAGITGCESSNGALKFSGSVAVSLEAAEKRGRVTARLANLVAITLPPAPPGFEWQLAFHDTRYLKQHTGILLPQNPSEGSTVSFVAVTTGSTRLRFLLLPVTPGRAVDPLDQQELIVTIR